MELEQIFYLLAALFGLAAIVYFTWEYIEVLPRITKVVLLFALSVVFFLIADMLRAREASPVSRASAKKARRVSA